MEKSNYINAQATIFDALAVMDKENIKLLIVVDSDDKFLSLLSIGDIQRAILSNKSIDSSVISIVRGNVLVGKISDSREYLTDLILSKKIEFIPIVDDSKNIIDVIYWKELTSEKRHNNQALKGIPVVIMAGGTGSRLKPITNIIPKPLVPVGEKAMIHIIMDKFMSFGCTEFYISISYKGEMIKQHLKELNLPCTIHYFEEDKPLGTAGSLSIIREKLTDTFIISNCDILINQDYEEVLSYHLKSNNKLTALAALKSFSIPYGVLETKEDGQLTNMEEKPSYNFQVNAGVYFLNNEALSLIADNEFYNITDMMEDLLKDDKRVGVFPVSEGSWFDIGEWKEYQRTQEIFKKINF
jgi:dTDP-glucose pyrophosphorylase